MRSFPSAASAKSDLRSTTCEGHYCFISLTTSEIILESADFQHNYEDHDEFIGKTRSKYELLAGCVKVDDDKVLPLNNQSKNALRKFEWDVQRNTLPIPPIH